MPEELLAKVLEAAGWQEGGLGFSRASATVRLVCAGWKAVYDALVRRLVMRPETTDEVVGMLVLRFPAVASLEFKSDTWGVSMSEALRAVSSWYTHQVFHRPREDGFAHPAYTSRANLAAALGPSRKEGLRGQGLCVDELWRKSPPHCTTCSTECARTSTCTDAKPATGPG
jgi:hypothetical protein